MKDFKKQVDFKNELHDDIGALRISQ